jgi:hypothetical protein
MWSALEVGEILPPLLCAINPEFFWNRSLNIELASIKGIMYLQPNKQVMCGLFFQRVGFTDEIYMKKLFQIPASTHSDSRGGYVPFLRKQQCMKWRGFHGQDDTLKGGKR